ncbi:hypothetical protein D3C81_1841940 [compost metagenome]
MVSGLAGPQISSIGSPPWAITTIEIITRKPNMVRAEAITAMSGAISSALTALDRTVDVSDSGNDFQNRMLRSRRSSYRAPRQ